MNIFKHIAHTMSLGLLFSKEANPAPVKIERAFIAVPYAALAHAVRHMASGSTHSTEVVKAWCSLGDLIGQAPHSSFQERESFAHMHTQMHRMGLALSGMDPHATELLFTKSAWREFASKERLVELAAHYYRQESLKVDTTNVAVLGVPNGLKSVHDIILQEPADKAKKLEMFSYTMNQLIQIVEGTPPSRHEMLLQDERFEQSQIDDGLRWN